MALIRVQGHNMSTGRPPSVPRVEEIVLDRSGGIGTCDCERANTQYVW